MGDGGLLRLSSPTTCFPSLCHAYVNPVSPNRGCLIPAGLVREPSTSLETPSAPRPPRPSTVPTGQARAGLPPMGRALSGALTVDPTAGDSSPAGRSVSSLRPGGSAAGGRSLPRLAVPRRASEGDGALGGGVPAATPAGTPGTNAAGKKELRFRRGA